MRHARGLIIGLLSLGPMACSGGGGGGAGEATGAVVGTLLDARSGQPVAAASVRVGGQEARSNEQGYFTLDRLPAGEALLLVIEHPDRPRSVRPITVRAGASTYVRWQLLAFEASQTFEAASGGAVEARGARVSFGPGVVDAAGPVTARLAYLDATQPGELAAFPGDFRTDQGGQLESFGAVAVTLTDAAGAPVNIAAGAQASLALPVAAGSPDELPLWHFDEDQGRWVEEGRLTGCADGVCDALLPHLSWWNADLVLETTCLTLCVTDDDGAPSAGVAIEATGVDYNGRSAATTDASGCACLAVRRDSSVSLVGIGPSGVVGPVTHRSAAAPAACGDPGCAPIAEPLTVSRPRFQATLSWGAQPADLDSHLTGPTLDGGRFHINYGQRGAAAESPFATLDTDDTDSFGPEITTLFRCLEGTYRYAVHNFSRAPAFDPAETTVHLLLPDGSSRTHRPPAGAPDLVWLVGELVCATGCSCQWQPLDRYAPAEEAQFHPQ